MYLKCTTYSVLTVWMNIKLCFNICNIFTENLSSGSELNKISVKIYFCVTTHFNFCVALECYVSCFSDMVCILCLFRDIFRDRLACHSVYCNHYTFAVTEQNAKVKNLRYIHACRFLQQIVHSFITFIYFTKCSPVEQWLWPGLCLVL